MGQSVFLWGVSNGVEVAGDVPVSQHRNKEGLNIWICVVFLHPFAKVGYLCMPVFYGIDMLAGQDVECSLVFFTTSRTQAVVLVISP